MLLVTQTLVMSSVFAYDEVQLQEIRMNVRVVRSKFWNSLVRAALVFKLSAQSRSEAHSVVFDLLYR